MQQVFIPDEQLGKEYVTITGEDAFHIARVLRMQPGEKIRVSTASGKSYLCRIAELTTEFVQADILSESVTTELPVPVALYQAIPKGDRMETVIEKAVELGVYSIVPVQMRFCVVKLDERKAQAKKKRWQAIAESAARQSKRSVIPEVRSVLSFEEAKRELEELSLAIIPYENERGMKATEEALTKLREARTVGILIGPEGGFAREEIDAVRPFASVISLGRRILRTDTAALTTLSAVMLRLEER